MIRCSHRQRPVSLGCFLLIAVLAAGSLHANKTTARVLERADRLDRSEENLERQERIETVPWPQTRINANLAYRVPVAEAIGYAALVRAEQGGVDNREKARAIENKAENLAGAQRLVAQAALYSMEIDPLVAFIKEARAIQDEVAQLAGAHTYVGRSLPESVEERTNALRGKLFAALEQHCGEATLQDFRAYLNGKYHSMSDDEEYGLAGRIAF